MDEFTVIIPVYNAARYLKQCIKSIINQDYKGIKIVAVNDASTDNSLDVLYELSKRYNGKKGKFIEVINLQKNGGVDNARFVALERLNTPYVMFVDSDDYLPKGSVSTLMRYSNKYNADVVEGGFRRFIGRVKLLSKNFSKEFAYIEQPELFQKYFVSFFGISLLAVSLWGKLYRSEVFKRCNIGRTCFKMGEDMFLNMTIFPTLHNYLIISEVVYCYRWGGVTSHWKPEIIKESIAQYKYRLELLRNLNYDRGVIPLQIEMVHLLISALRYAIRDGWTDEDMIKLIKDDNINHLLLECTQSEQYNGDYYIAIQEIVHHRRDPQFLFDRLRSECKKDYLKSNVLKLLDLF